MIALRNLRRKPVRTLITLSGASVGIAVFVALTSISGSVRKGLSSVLSAHGTDVSVQTLRAATPAGSRIPAAEADRLALLEGVEAAAPIVLGSVRTPWNPFFFVFGTTAGSAGRLGVSRGRCFEEEAPEILLGEVAYRALGVELGGTVSLAGRDFTLVGTYVTGAPMLDGGGVTHLGAAQRVLDQPGFVNLVFLRLRSGVSAQRIVAEVRRGVPRLRASPGGDLVSQLQIFRTINAFARAVSLAGLLASCLVVTNTLLMAVWDRTREIGILRAVGWSKLRIVGSLVAEALLLCLGSALGGNLLGLLFLRAVERTANASLGWVPVAVPPGVFWSSLGISGLLGVVCAIYPAVVCTALSPARALRHE